MEKSQAPQSMGLRQPALATSSGMAWMVLTWRVVRYRLEPRLHYPVGAMRMESGSGTKKPERVPGYLGRITVRVTVSLVALVIVLSATYLNYRFPSLREHMRFFGGALGIAAGVLAAYYGTKSLETTIGQRAEAQRAQNISRAFVYVDGWDKPDFSETRKRARGIADSVKAMSPEEVIRFMADQDKEAVMLDVFNFFEGMALAANSGIADGETLARCFRGVLLDYWLHFEPWIKNFRARTKQSLLYDEIQTLTTAWKKT